MSDHVHLVFAHPAPSVSTETFHAWYRDHLREILAVPGWLAARRYALQPLGDRRAPATAPYLAAYEVAPDLAANMAALGEGRDERRANGPSWVAENRYASWNATQLGARRSITLPERVVLVCAAVPRVATAAFDAWQAAAVESARETPGVEGAWRFALEANPLDDAAALAPAFNRLTLYAVKGHFDPLELAAPAVGGPPGSDGFGFAAAAGSAITPRVAS